MKVALIQMDLGLGQPEDNRSRALELIDQAVEQGAEWVILPEMWTCGYDLKRLEHYAEGVNGPTVTRLRKKAEEAGIYIFAGSLPEKQGEGIFNTCFVIGPQGEILGKYSKIHLFSLMEEQQYMRSGEASCLVETPLGKVGVIICYDLRFPELARRLVLQGARVLVVPAQFPEPRADHWRILNQARAVENQIYVLAVNRVGKDEKNTFFGQSMAVDPWGEVAALGGDGEEVILIDLDSNLIDKVRRTIPCLKDRRPELY
ncbi:MAG: carbon-nitrogen family hydrolase [Thermincolia bacterium]